MANGPQFDPVAASAISALDTTQRGLRQFRQQANAPQLPGTSQAFSTSRSLIQSLSQFSPANVLAQGDLPGLPGQQGQDPLSQAFQQLPVPGQQGQFQIPQPPVPSQRGGGGGGDSGASTTDSGGQSFRDVTDTR